MMENLTCLFKSDAHTFCSPWAEMFQFHVHLDNLVIPFIVLYIQLLIPDYSLIIYLNIALNFMVTQRYILEYCSLLLYSVITVLKEVFWNMNNGCLFITELLFYGNYCSLYELPVKAGNKFVNKIFCKKVYSVKKAEITHTQTTLKTLVHELYTHPSLSL